MIIFTTNYNIVPDFVYYIILYLYHYFVLVKHIKYMISLGT